MECRNFAKETPSKIIYTKHELNKTAFDDLKWNEKSFANIKWSGKNIIELKSNLVTEIILTLKVDEKYSQKHINQKTAINIFNNLENNLIVGMKHLEINKPKSNYNNYSILLSSMQDTIKAINYFKDDTKSDNKKFYDKGLNIIKSINERLNQIDDNK